jgi:hypothetical protein
MTNVMPIIANNKYKLHIEILKFLGTNRTMMQNLVLTRVLRIPSGSPKYKLR